MGNDSQRDTKKVGGKTMGELIEIVTPLHKATVRDCLSRMNDNKVEAMIKAKEYDFDYWDGDRRYGYGGYKYIPGRWRPVAEAFIERYKLGPGSKVLDIGCGKGFLLYELQLLEPKLELFGIDISQHGLDSRNPNLLADLRILRCEGDLPWPKDFFDLSFSLGTFHNLHLPELNKALVEMNRVGRQNYLMIESFRNEQEQFNLECWALTAETLINTKSWQWMFKTSGYTGDYEFIYF
jgi:SAM-dependent methyltransferase